LSHYDDGGSPHALFSSLDFNADRDSLLPISPAICMQKLTAISTGILAFDILIWNPDRHDQNLWCDNTANPTRLLVFDHDVALLGTKYDGIARLNAAQTGLGLSSFAYANEHHCFLDRLSDTTVLEPWVSKIAEIPDWFIEDRCSFARHDSIGLDAPTSKQLAKLLIDRKRRFDSILTINKTSFASVKTWNLGGLVQ